MHDPARGEVWAKPKVHRGFQRCWLANDFNLRVKQHILGLLQQGALQRGKVKLYVTGECPIVCANFLSDQVFVMQLIAPVALYSSFKLLLVKAASKTASRQGLQERSLYSTPQHTVCACIYSHRDTHRKSSCAGHSLGGALATLAAYSLRHMEDEHGPLELRVCCYTFGMLLPSPRAATLPVCCIFISFNRQFDKMGWQ